MKVQLITVALMIMSTGCLPVSDIGSATLAKYDDHKKESVTDCFEVLIPGALEGGTYKDMYFGNGDCQGTSRSLSKMSKQSEVAIYQDGERYESQLFYEDFKVFAKISGERVDIGKISKKWEEADLKFNSNVSMSLVVKGKDGIFRKWAHGDNASYASEEIRLQIK